MRVNADLAVSPTRLEFISGSSGDLGVMHRFQGSHRPVKAHAMVLATRAWEEFTEHIAKRGIPHSVERNATNEGLNRITIGTTGPGADYDPRHDAGLFVRVIDMHTMHLPDTVFDAFDGMTVDTSHPGDMVRVSGRDYLTTDLEGDLRVLASSLAWEPEGPVVIGEDGTRHATLSFRHPSSGWVRLVQPVPDSEPGAFLAEHGPGPHTIYVEVNGLDAKRNDLESRRTPYQLRPADVTAPERIRLDPAVLHGGLLEFVDRSAAW